LTYLATERIVSASTQNQAQSAILFLYKQVLKVELPWLGKVFSAKRGERLPFVLNVRESLQYTQGTMWRVMMAPSQALIARDSSANSHSFSVAG
jgi:hypothetical protein